MLHEGNGRIYIDHMSETSVFFAMVTGIGHGIVGQQLHLTWNHLQLMTGKLLANRLESPSALAANARVFRQFQQNLLFLKIGGHFLQRTLFLPGMGLDGKGFLGGFLRFVVLFLFRFVEQTELLLAHDVGHLQPLHEPAETLRIQLTQFCFRPGPLEPSVRKPFIQQNISIPGSVQCLDPVGAPAAEQKQTFFVQMSAKLLS